MYLSQSSKPPSLSLSSLLFSFSSLSLSLSLSLLSSQTLKRNGHWNDIRPCHQYCEFLLPPLAFSSHHHHQLRDVCSHHRFPARHPVLSGKKITTIQSKTTRVNPLTVQRQLQYQAARVTTVRISNMLKNDAVGQAWSERKRMYIIRRP